MPSPLALFGFALILGSIPLGVHASRRLRVYRASKRWPTVEATITRSELQEKTDSDGTSYRAELVYRYAVLGRVYLANLHTEGLAFPATEKDARQMVARFPVGSQVQVAVNPANPARAMLDTGVPHASIVLRNASVVAFVVGAVIAAVETGFAG